MTSEASGAGDPEGKPGHWIFAPALWEWITIRQYTDSLLAATGASQKVTAAHY